ncbi:ATP/maltotriose-dependent transcriptional regulator MalT [Thermosporothrix hazakensis]|jgi:ATP/maltotriose-dependent transcriptional regulator MalT/two-component SAPR family response regulator|uniref:ATP/maltotriose-dependent transcriptional regulator MalT n=1 Tax=Thermosporothrix hazakensis TaxID=644383 RepID=A0A326UC25_THEHA|nr:tetratricopeptide repeat protein [Thermosporothrix hazakensis]PZW22831.1 ATP/maltotriose-dependent transcriptional regulator MalT [Thermosporothrix hazakensis]GCE49799.1 hypothetical protein KTH_46680 [Thermosporothrix hazakensis]
MGAFDVSSKVHIPAIPRTFVRRNRLLSILKGALDGEHEKEYRVILLCAPGGYGKTTALVDYIRQAQLPCCWYTLEPMDADAITFLRVLVTSIQHVFPHFGKSVSARLSGSAFSESEALSGPVLMDALLTAIENEIQEHFLLVLNDFHEVNNSAPVLELLNHFLRKQPQHCTVVVESRAVPRLELAPLLARREVYAIGNAHFRFLPDEICELARVQGSITLTLQEAEKLAHSFDGWIAGILLGTRLGEGQMSPGGGRILSGTSTLRLERQQLFAYLVHEVFKREQEVYAFLKEVAILPQMAPEVCDALLQRNDSASRLSYLEQQGLFVSQVETDEGPFFLCHPVLRDMLCEEFQREQPERYTELQRRASEFFCQRGEYQQALYHAQRAGEYEQMACLLQDAYQQSVKRGRSSEGLAHWIDDIPTDIWMKYPRLPLIRASLYLAQGDIAHALPLLTRSHELVDNAAETMESEDRRLLQAEIALARSKALFFSGNYVQAQILCQQALPTIPADEVPLLAEAHLRLGMCAQMLGCFGDCIRELQQALRLWGYGIAAKQTALLHSQLANTYSLMGNLALAEHHYRRAMSCLEELHDDYERANTLIGRGVTLQRYGKYDEAVTVLQEALDLARKIGFRRAEAYALVSLGDVYQDQGKYDQALLMMEDGLSLASQLAEHYLVGYTHNTLAMTYLLMGDPHTALVHLAQTEATADEKTSYHNELGALVRGTVWLYQQEYQQAKTCFLALAETLHAKGYKRELVQVMVRLAACYGALQERDEAVRHLERAQRLAEEYHYEALLPLELERLPGIAETLRFQHERDSNRELPVKKEAVPQNREPQSRAKMPDAYSRLQAVKTEVVPKLRILALGEPVVLLEGKPITRWRMARAMELCFFLLDKGKPVHKEQIMLALWPEVDEAIDQTLRSTIYYLRKALGEGCISYRSGYYALNLQAHYGDEVCYDVAQFEEYYKEAKENYEVKEFDEAYELFLRMVHLYRGDYAQSFYHDWCIPRREELRLAYLDARRHLALICWKQGEYQESASHWQQMLIVDRCMEEAHYGLMRCYMQMGKRSLALRQYQRCAEALQEELGIEPGERIQHLYQRLTGQVRE